MSDPTPRDFIQSEMQQLVAETAVIQAQVRALNARALRLHAVPESRMGWSGGRSLRPHVVLSVATLVGLGLVALVRGVT
ncbi:hypothetical protein [Variovorax sp. ZT4R33]|uniref:hypothetical protein n=1 Tax=Variovorax sp. ZT4R33 TaxID=3443743 RepID=UPI003F45AC81